MSELKNLIEEGEEEGGGGGVGELMPHLVEGEGEGLQGSAKEDGKRGKHCSLDSSCRYPSNQQRPLRY